MIFSYLYDKDPSSQVSFKILVSKVQPMQNLNFYYFGFLYNHLKPSLVYKTPFFFSCERSWSLENFANYNCALCNADKKNAIKIKLHIAHQTSQ